MKRLAVLLLLAALLTGPAQGAQARLSAQHGAQFYASRSRVVIENSGTQHELCEKARAAAELLKR